MKTKKEQISDRELIRKKKADLEQKEARVEKTGTIHKKAIADRDRLHGEIDRLESDYIIRIFRASGIDMEQFDQLFGVTDNRMIVDMPDSNEAVQYPDHTEADEPVTTEAKEEGVSEENE